LGLAATNQAEAEYAPPNGFLDLVAAIFSFGELKLRPQQEVAMRHSAVRALLLALGFVLLTSVVRGQQSPPDLVMFNGKIFTGNSRQPYAEALAIRGDRIVAVGTNLDSFAKRSQFEK